MFTTRPGTASPIQVSSYSSHIHDRYLYFLDDCDIVCKKKNNRMSLSLQRTFTGVDVFTVFQDVYLKTTNDPRVSNIVKFSDFIGELKVEVSFFI